MTPRILISMVGLLLAAHLRGQASTPPTIPLSEFTVVLDPLLVSSSDEDDDSYDATGMGSAEAELKDAPFSNDLIGGFGEQDQMDLDMDEELTAATGTSEADLAGGVDRLNLRGFPTPRLRNGFTQIGIPEILNAGGRLTIQGPLTPVLGRAAPGGISNYNTPRPRSKPSTRLQFSASDFPTIHGKVDTTGPLVAKKVWQRTILEVEHREGPEKFAQRDVLTFDEAITIRHSRAASTMVQIDYQEYRANASDGVPEFRETRQGKIIDRYRPLADFNINGPGTNIYKRVGSASVQFDAQLNRHLSLKASLQAWMRELDEDRWAKGEYLLDEGVFRGVRQPLHRERPANAVASQIDLVARYRALGMEHKLLASVEGTLANSQIEQRGMSTANRNALLPDDVRTFDPFNPNYFRPEYSEENYDRVITDRDEEAQYAALVVGDRFAIANGRFVGTAGLRYDMVDFTINDERPTAPVATVTDSTSELTHHFGGNLVVVPSKLLLFANSSSAFEPSTRTDSRTGKVQGNETTSGYEAGLKTLFWERRVSLTAMAFSFVNQNISRRNPLYNDPVADANQTQPQLVAAGEEEFKGVNLRLNGELSEGWSVSARASYTRAITTSSPDLPEEQGKAITRLPDFSMGLSARYRVPEGHWKGLSLGTSLVYVSGYVVNYERSDRAYLEYPSYATVSLSLGYRWDIGKVKHSLSLSARNLLDEDLLEKTARTGADRQLSLGYSLYL